VLTKYIDFAENIDGILSYFCRLTLRTECGISKTKHVYCYSTLKRVRANHIAGRMSHPNEQLHHDLTD
jgi:hypothetical protein